MPEFLFVYGTLMGVATSGMGTAERQRLHDAAISLGAATMDGRLFDLGAYPGMVTNGDPGDAVHGEVLRLERPGDVLPWLDAYEGIVAGSPDNEYARVEAEARPGNGETVTAWVYAFTGELAGRRRIADGRWR